MFGILSELGDISGGQVKLGVVWRDGVIEPLPSAQKLLHDVAGASKIETIREKLIHTSYHDTW